MSHLYARRVPIRLLVSKAFFAVLGALFLLPSSLVGCGQSGSTSGTTTLRIWYSTDDPIERQWSQQLARQFERAHPRIRVELTDFSFEDINTKLQLALSAGTPPDIAYVTPRGPGIPAYVGAHRLHDLTTDAWRLHWRSRLAPGLLDQYNRPFAYFGAPTGHIVAVPTALAGVGLMVNLRLLRRLKLALPRSLPQLEADMARAHAHGFTAAGLGNADGWLGDDWYLTLVNALVPPARLESEQRLDPRFTFQQSAMTRAAATLQRWATAGYFTHDFGGLDAQEGVDQFFHGATLFQLVSSSENSQILQDQRSSGLPITLLGFPAAYGGTVMPVTGYEGWVVPSTARYPRDATAFIDLLLSPGTGQFLRDHGVLPAHRMVAEHNGKGFLGKYLRSLSRAHHGIYLDAAPVSNLNATMEANVQLLLQRYEGPGFLTKSLQEVYHSHGHGGSAARIDGEF